MWVRKHNADPIRVNKTANFAGVETKPQEKQIVTKLMKIFSY